MKIDVEDVLCKAEAISLQMVKCKVYSIFSNWKIFLSVWFWWIDVTNFFFLEVKLARWWQTQSIGQHLFTIIDLQHLIENNWIIMLGDNKKTEW